MNCSHLAPLDQKALDKPIPTFTGVTPTAWREIQIHESGEAMVMLSRYGFLTEARYFKAGLPGAPSECFAREGLAEKLLVAKRALPRGFNFLIFDAWRPLEVQERLFENVGGDERYIAPPSADPRHPSPHLTGGAVDLTIINERARALEMGTDFDFFGPEAALAFFETHGQAYPDQDRVTRVRQNRRLLFTVMWHAGFRPFPTEWWHWNYGNQPWALFEKTVAFYGLTTAPR